LVGNGKKGNLPDATLRTSKGAVQKAQIQKPKEFKMFSHRLFNIIVVIGLVVVVGLTVREVSATSTVVSQRDTVNRPSAECVVDLPSRVSIHTEYVKETGVWMTYTEDGPTGVDGGLIYLLSNRQSCSK
jgi:hypothetical protein